MKLNNDFILRTVAGEHMLVNTKGKRTDQNSFFSINDPVEWLWNKINGQEFTEEMLVDWICEEYEVEREVAATDVENLLKMWKTFGILAE